MLVSEISTIETLKISNIGTGEALDGRLFGNSRVASIDSDGDAALEASGPVLNLTAHN